MQVVCGQRSSVAPQLLEYLSFARPYSDGGYTRNAAGTALVTSAWRQLYECVHSIQYSLAFEVTEIVFLPGKFAQGLQALAEFRPKDLQL